MALKIGNQLKPTDEQREAITYFAEGDNLVIEAGAGTGKTSTLVMLGKYNKAPGQYIAFNKSIVEDSKAKLPGNIKSNTAHSLAFGAVGHTYKSRLFSGKRMRSIDIANILGIKPRVIQLSHGSGRKVLSASYLASLVMRGITNFCNSDAPVIEGRFVPYIDGIDMPQDGKRGYEHNNEIRSYLEPFMKKAWADLQDHYGQLQFKHEHYLKMWQLGDPTVDAEFILFDEAQDANPVILDIVRRQEHAQLIFVGDSQQQIYSFTGAVNALQNVPASNKTYLTQSFRFGPEIANCANRVLRLLDSPLQLKGLDSIPSKIGHYASPDVILTRTNAMAVKYALDYQAGGKRVALVGGADEIARFAKGVKELMNGGKTSHPDLACFDSWEEIKEYVAFDEQGSDLKLIVDLISQYGIDVILNVVGKVEHNEGNADVIISTAHKAKGREWEYVKLAEDFPSIERAGAEELRLMYVAITRAKLGLDIGIHEWLLNNHR